MTLLKKYKRCLDAVRNHLNDKKLELDSEKLDELVGIELEKPINEMDTDLIDLCLDALVAHRAYAEKRGKRRFKGFRVRTKM